MALEMRKSKNFGNGMFSIRCSKCGMVSKREYLWSLKCPLCEDVSATKYSYIFEIITQRIKYYTQTGG